VVDQFLDIGTIPRKGDQIDREIVEVGIGDSLREKQQRGDKPGVLESGVDDGLVVS